MLRRFHIPWVTAVIFAGIILGPYGLSWVVPGEIMEFLSTIGLVFLMFTAGLDTKFSVLKTAGKEIMYFSMLNLGVPMAAGFTLGFFAGMGVFASLLLGIVFSSSSIGVVSPLLKELKIEPKVKSVLTSSIFLEDVVSLILLAVLLNAVTPLTPVPLTVFPFVLLIFLLIVFYVIPIIQEWFFYWESKDDMFAGQMRGVMLTLALVALMAELIGIHAMVGGFLAGLTLSEMVGQRKKLGDNVMAVSYGFLIPIFLLYLGMTTNISTLFSPGDAGFTLAIISALTLSKTLSGYAAARIIGFDTRTGLGMGLMTSAQLSTTLATASLGLQYGIFGENILTALVILSVVTIVVSPFLAKLMFGYEEEKQSEFVQKWVGTEQDDSSLKELTFEEAVE